MSGLIRVNTVCQTIRLTTLHFYKVCMYEIAASTLTLGNVEYMPILTFRKHWVHVDTSLCACMGCSLCLLIIIRSFSRDTLIADPVIMWLQICIYIYIVKYLSSLMGFAPLYCMRDFFVYLPCIP